MALRAYELGQVKKMDKAQRTHYFENFAAFIPDSPKLCYAIRVGNKTLMSSDTHDLRQQFDKYVRYTRVK